MARNPVVLVVDDEKQIQRLLKLGLGSDKFKVVGARDAAEALTTFAHEEIDLVILDIGLPDRNGLDLLGEIRKISAVPVIVLSVRDNEADKVRAFDLGADDYVTKPFSMSELSARLRVALKHRYQSQGIQPVVRLGELEIDLINRQVRNRGHEVNLTRTEFEILCLLAKHPGKVLTHDFLLRHVRGLESGGDPQYLRVYVRALRNKLGDRAGASKIIRTEMGVGYRLMVTGPETVTGSP
jgi:two-component system KDP operon response regulator KdpE